MLAYAEHRRRVAASRSAPHAMLGIMVAHIAAIAVVMSAKMDLPRRIFEEPLVIESIPLPKPSPEPLRNQDPPKRPQTVLDQPMQIAPLDQPPTDTIDTNPMPLQLGSAIGPKIEPMPFPQPTPVRVGPRFVTPAGLVRPPYPLDKLKSEEEAELRLRLAIDETGRVVSVEPVGGADRAFLAAARRHILARWHYLPAMEGSRPMASSTVITLRFELQS